MNATHTPGPWKILPCPIHGGKHPLQDCRYIATHDAAVEMSPHVPDDWCLSSGSLICAMRDTANQPHDARLIAAAPELLQALEAMLVADTAICENIGRKSDQAMQRIAAIDFARATLAKATGQPRHEY